MSSLDWKDLLAFFIALGSVVFNSTPILEQHLSNLSSHVCDQIIKTMEDQIQDLPDLDDESPSTWILRYYHHLLDNALKILKICIWNMFGRWTK